MTEEVNKNEDCFTDIFCLLGDRFFNCTFYMVPSSRSSSSNWALHRAKVPFNIKGGRIRRYSLGETILSFCICTPDIMSSDAINPKF